MAYVELGMDHWHTGKRSKKYYTKPYDISDGLWEALQDFAENNDFCIIGVWDYDKGKLYMHRMKELDEVFKQHCNAPKDWEMFHEIQKEGFGGNINIMEMKFKYEYVKEVIAVDTKRRRCVVEKTLPRKQFQEWVESHASPPPTSQYEVAISDRCIFEGIKPKDKVLIRKFLDDTHMAVYVSESYTPPTREEIEQQRKSLNDLMGDY